MTDASPSNTSDNTEASHTNSGSPGDLLIRPPIRRARAQLSCTPCRQGKLKCNREHPVCDQCTKRGRKETCLYVPPPAKNKQAHNMRGRIRNLENLVVTLINQKSQVQGVPTGQCTDSQSQPTTSGGPEQPANEEPNVDSFGQLRISNAGNENYVGATHWSNILKEIEEVKESLRDDDWEQEIQEEEWDHFNARSSVTFGIPKPTSKAMLIQELNNVGKAEVDRLLPLWFNSADPHLFIIHAPTFVEEYKQFWRDPSHTTVMWMAMLFSIMALGIIVGPRNPGMMNLQTTTQGSRRPPHDDKDHLFRAVDKFQQLASSAMVLADIAKSQPYTLETMMIYGECEFLRRDDHHTKVWLMDGLTIRVALKMGYHRDPSNFSGVTPFQGEMRRRVFHVLNMMDTLVSFAIGLPTLLRNLESDVRAPRNLYDTDFSPASEELPKERPHTELTPALYSIAKSRVCRVFAEAVELSQKIVPPKHSHIMTLDARLEEAHDAIPLVLRVRPMDDCITDPPVLIMSRFNIELLYQKTRIVLHRNYLIAGQSDPRFAESRKICLEAARKSLIYQNSIFHACQPGGQLNKVWWYMSSLNTYDFLLAAMVLCLELHHLQGIDSTSPQSTEILAILENTHSIWANHHNRYKGVARGAEILRAMINKSTKLSKQPAGLDLFLDDSVTSFAKAPFEATPGSTAEELPPQIWGTWQSTNDISSFDPPEMPGGIDWNVLDSTMQGQTHMLTHANWAPTQPINTTMDEWMAMSAGVDTMLDNMNDFQDPLNLPNSTGYVPPLADMNWSLQ